MENFSEKNNLKTIRLLLDYGINYNKMNINYSLITFKFTILAIKFSDELHSNGQKQICLKQNIFC